MTRHVPVLSREVVDGLQLKPNQNAIDCTLGDAGHSEILLGQNAPDGKLLGIDADPESLLRAKQYLYTFGDRVQFVRDNFSNLEKIVSEQKFGPVHAILMDLGWSSPQFAERGRGFSFDKTESLDMRYPGSQKSDLGNRPASEFINELNQDELRRIFKLYGEEKFAAEIATAIVEARKIEPIVNTKQLVDIILMVYREKLNSTKAVPWIGGIHPATKVFQALRIAVNDELNVLQQTLPQAISVLAPGGRLAVISFHSLEDRIVKHYFQKEKNKLKIITKKPLIASDDEVEKNPRSRSAKLRIVEKI